MRYQERSILKSLWINNWNQSLLFKDTVNFHFQLIIFSLKDSGSKSSPSHSSIVSYSSWERSARALRRCWYPGGKYRRHSSLSEWIQISFIVRGFFTVFLNRHHQKINIWFLMSFLISSGLSWWLPRIALNSCLPFARFSIKKEFGEQVAEENNQENWILYVLDAFEATAKQTREKICK